LTLTLTLFDRFQNDDIIEHLSKILPDCNAKRGIKRRADTDLSSIIEKISKLAKQESTQDKYKVISCQPLTTVSEENSHKWTTLVEIENCLNIDTGHQNVKNEVNCKAYIRLVINTLAIEI